MLDRQSGGEVPAHSPAVAAAIGTYFDTWVAALSRAIEEAKQAGEISTDIPAQDLAEFLVNAWEGGAVHAKTTASTNPVRTFERMIAHLLP